MSPPISVILAKRKKVVDSATRMFLELGYDKMTIDALTEKVGGSKTYIFKNFGGKEELFDAVIRAACEEILKPLTGSTIESTDLRIGLAELATRFLQVSLSPRSIALHRLVIAERLRFPHLGKLFLESGPEKSFAIVAEFLGRQQKLGHMVAGDVHELAVEFLGLVNAGFLQQMLIAGHALPNKLTRQRRIATAVSIFMNGIAAGEEPISDPP